MSTKRKLKEEKEEGRAHKKARHAQTAGKEEAGPEDVESRAVLERGHVYFFYRPRVEMVEAHAMADVQRLYMLIVPQGHEEHARLIMVPKKRLPSVRTHQREFALVDVAGPLDYVVSKLKGEVYQTKTRGQRHLAPARLLARGVYVLARHHEQVSAHTMGNHIHLAYVLTSPEQPHALQLVFNIQHEGDVLIQVRNPLRRSGGFHTEVVYPHDLQTRFEGRAFIPLDPPTFLNYSGGHLLFVGAHTGLESIGAEAEALEKQAHKEASQGVESIRRELHVTKGALSTDPLGGHWA